MMLPFGPEAFDYAWTQHVAMNIADRASLYGGIYKVLRPGGRFAIYDVVKRGAAGLQFPVPWARDPAHSFLLTADETRDVLESAGFVILHWRNATELALAWRTEAAAAEQTRPEQLRNLALPLIMGPQFPSMAANLRRNFEEGKVALLQAVLERPR
jgi:SAM-dependent methyltransferase